MEIKVRVLNSGAVDDKMECVKEEPVEKPKILTSRYLHDLNRDVTSRIREKENANKEAYYLVKGKPFLR